MLFMSENFTTRTLSSPTTFCSLFLDVSTYGPWNQSNKHEVLEYIEVLVRNVQYQTRGYKRKVVVLMVSTRQSQQPGLIYYNSRQASLAITIGKYRYSISYIPTLENKLHSNLALRWIHSMISIQHSTINLINKSMDTGQSTVSTYKSLIDAWYPC